MASIRQHIPNVMTLLNLLSGGIAATFVAYGDFETAMLFIGFSLIFDLLDGALARILKAQSNLGKDLDSLADMVSFGFTPSLLLYTLIAMAGVEWFLLPYLGFLPMLAAAWRLASFNQASDQSKSFKGLPTPAAAIIIMTIPLMHDSSIELVEDLLNSPGFLILMGLLVAVLMVSPIRLFSLKMSRFDLKSNLHRYIMLIGMIVTLMLQWELIGIIFLILYLSISLIFREKISAEESDP